MAEEIKNSKYHIRLPIVFCVALAGGLFIGTKFAGKSIKSGNIEEVVASMREILTHIENEYVDTVNTDQLANDAITGMLEKLDPHTAYIPAKDLQMAKTQLEGDFDGIGIEFQIIKDTIYVVSPINGGPSEAIGLKSGDKIVKIDDKLSAGVKISTQDVFGKLRGKKGTKVKVSIARKGEKSLLEYTITRDKIPTYSVDVAYMIDSKIGYIKVSRFAANTYKEFHAALQKLIDKGMKQLVLDLRDNPGGYLDRATDMTDELLDGNKLIVYTNGKVNEYDQKINAYNTGLFEKGAVIVLINEGSASASEIMSGAIQDNDRGLIVGRRSFGKGLVQRPIPLRNGGELRLTISRYYTPSGRSIQKHYDKNNSDEYEMDMLKRYEHGEFYHADSIKFNDSLKFQTSKGRTVFGGGGIMPDVFVPRDTSMFSKYLGELFNKSIIREYTLNYVIDNKKEFEGMPFETFKNKFVVSDKMLDDVNKLAEKTNIKFNKKEFERSKPLIKNNIKAAIARSFWKNDGFYPILNETDEIFKQALKLMDKAADIEQGKF